jgi:hypothetical protein
VNGRSVKPHPYSVSQILHEAELYTVKGAKSDDVIFGETTVFCEIDNNAAPVFKSILANETSLSALQREHLWRFMYTLQVRNPRTIMSLASDFEGLEENALQALIAKHGPPIPGRPLLSDLVKSPEDAGKFLAVVIARNDQRYRRYFNMRHAFVMFNDPISLLTSDYPFLTFPDFDQPNMIFIFPIAPNCCFLAFTDPQLENLWLTHFPRIQLADLINFLIISQATHVYSNKLQNEAQIYDLMGCSTNVDVFRHLRDRVMIHQYRLFEYY